MMMPKNTKKCAWCGIRKNIKYFGKNKEYCKSCFHTYLKHFTPIERKILLVSDVLKDNKDKILTLMQIYPKQFKQLRYWIKRIPTEKQRKAWENIWVIFEWLY